MTITTIIFTKLLRNCSRPGVRFAISTGDGGAEVRDLPYQAGIAGAFGLSKEDALKSVTLYPAEILGISDRLGSIEVGKLANIVVTDGDLLEPRTNIKYLFIGGRLLPLTSDTPSCSIALRIERKAGSRFLSGHASRMKCLWP
jgi:imidazolonepropionase-like amidohydrolase